MCLKFLQKQWTKLRGPFRRKPKKSDAFETNNNTDKVPEAMTYKQIESNTDSVYGITDAGKTGAFEGAYKDIVEECDYHQALREPHVNLHINKLAQSDLNENDQEILDEYHKRQRILLESFVEIHKIVRGVIEDTDL
ncbi:unnamed protein product [Owenia fusiformis]|uniref:Uncharacterized protein n=1 Tax=Owenia fusiformis TaxID=6347 RepID=A0A8S4NPU7_OWEFU|nr:unnamed protein product [Owenia fusiformis]